MGYIKHIAATKQGEEMEDRELLELSAKSVGYNLVWGDVYIVDGENIDFTDLPYVRSNQQDEADWYWNPLEDDGDALRLAVNLGLEIYEGIDEAGGLTGAVYFVEHESRPKVAMEYHKEHSNKYSAARRAIVRASAEIGKQMP